MPNENKNQDGNEEINNAIWKQTRVVIKRVKTGIDPRICYKNFVYEVSNIIIQMSLYILKLITISKNKYSVQTSLRM